MNAANHAAQSSLLNHEGEISSNIQRAALCNIEPRALRTFTPSQAVLSYSAGIFHWTPEGRKLYDYTSGVLVSNLGHNPIRWNQRLHEYMKYTPTSRPDAPIDVPEGYFPAVPLTAYNAVTPVEVEASRRLVDLLESTPGGRRLNQVMWAASGSEAIQKALWASLARDRTRPMILATRNGFHGKKGLANAVTGSETDAERDPRVRFISFPTRECQDISLRGNEFDPSPYRQELEALYHQFGRRIGTLITEPYLGGGGSYHPPAAYLQMLQAFCREYEIAFILDEVQANFGRTAKLFAFEAYGLEPDIVVLGKGLGNGVPVAAAVGRKDIFATLDYGEGSDTWSANPLCCAAVLATLDEFAAHDVMAHARTISVIIEAGLEQLKSLPFVAAIRGEYQGMVWGIEFREYAGKTASEWANAAVLACYRGETGVNGQSLGIHLLGPLAKKVVRVSPPLIISEVETRNSMALMQRLFRGMIESPKIHSAPATSRLESVGSA